MSSGIQRTGPICTYFIRRGEDGPIKIGRSRDVQARLAELGAASPEPLVLLAVLPTNRERELHVLLAKHRMCGEWFAPAPEVLAEVAKAYDPPPPKEKAPYVHRSPPPRRDRPVLRVPWRPVGNPKSIAESIANRVIFDAMHGKWKKDPGSP